MKLLDAIDATPKQRMTLIGDDGQKIAFNLYYMPAVQCWCYDLSYQLINISGVRLCVGPNILSNYSNLINFGIGCVSTDGYDPFYLSDFINGRIKLYLLNNDDLTALKGML